MAKTKNDKLSLIKDLNDTVATVIGQDKLEGFERAYLLADATEKLKGMLTDTYMKPIMALQGNKLGFKTDKDDSGGYPVTIVRNCLIEAVLTGVQPFGNQFNIIAKNMYLTKEGFGYLLKKIPDFKYQIKPELPRISADKKSAAIVMNIDWKFKGGPVNNEKIEIPIKVNAYMGTDAIIGKATRKARAWLYNTVTGSEISDGDIDDHDPVLKSSSHNSRANASMKEDARILKHIEEAGDLETLEDIEKYLSTDDQRQAYEQKKHSLVFDG